MSSWHPFVSVPRWTDLASLLQLQACHKMMETTRQRLEDSQNTFSKREKQIAASGIWGTGPGHDVELNNSKPPSAKLETLNP